MCDPLTIGAGVAGIAGNILGANASSAAAQRARESYQQGIANATNTVNQGVAGARSDINNLYGQATDQYSPYSQAGSQALDIYKAALGMPSSSQFNPQTSGLYNWQLQQGMRGQNAALAQRGLAGSPAGMRSVGDFISRLGAEEGTRQMGYLTDLIGRGATAANAAANVQQNQGNQLADVGLKGASAIGGYQEGLGLANASIDTNLGNIQNNMYKGIGTSFGTMLGGFKSMGGDNVSDVNSKLPDYSIPETDFGRVNAMNDKGMQGMLNPANQNWQNQIGTFLGGANNTYGYGNVHGYGLSQIPSMANRGVFLPQQGGY